MEGHVKRVRSNNWSEKEKKMLKMLVLERADVIENKDTSTNANASKKLAWEEVLSCFNTISPNKRDMGQLLNQWRNMKYKDKKSEFTFRRVKITTGGGDPPPSPPVEDQILMEAFAHEFGVDSNKYNSDPLHIKRPESSETVANSSSQPQNIVERDVTQELSHNQQHGETSKKKLKRCTGDCCKGDHEHALFLLAKAAREEAMKREREAHECKMKNERELHENRLAIMSLEKEYWLSKIKKNT
ncbi:hypothetical protein K1T71_014566 [Dendrolimus kikuchii]|uniref:Uncharacterized protein n=1 Tax=Dendrolimus kikuchii TaxID=765133 RepID=A0ACC1CEP4_9NEOP|nr:hypothetical protein K1T71_014566 [Dendrolimus kikuchii]